MNKEEKIKLQIERLKIRNEDDKFKLSQWNNLFIKTIAILISIFIPVIIITREKISLPLIIILTFLLVSLYITIRVINKNHTFKINENNLKIESLFKELLGKD